MTIPSAAKSAFLNGLTFTQASLHVAFPGTTGANEVSGGTPAYARKNITVNTESGGQRLLNAAVTFDVPACTVKWIGFWNASTFIGSAPNGGATPKNFMAQPSTGLVYATGHGWSDGQTIVFFGIPPSGLTEGTTYYTRDGTADTFKVAASAGGTAIAFTTASSYGCVVIAITETVFTGQDTHQLNAATIALPD